MFDRVHIHAGFVGLALVLGFTTPLASQGPQDWPQVRGATRNGLATYVVSLLATDGQLLWRRPFVTEWAQNVITPVVIGNSIVIGGYQKATVAFRVVRSNDQWTTEDLWSNPEISQFMANGVMVGDALFGLSHRNRGQYFLLDTTSGKTMWTGMPRQAENAAIVRAGNVVISLEDDAELMVGRVTGSQFQEVKRYTVADSATWAAPVISGDRIFVKDVSTLALWT